MSSLVKYQSTPHLETSRLQKGDAPRGEKNYDYVRLSDLGGRRIVVEEKIDGGQVGTSFDETLRQRNQSRGHYLDGGDLEQYDMFKQWTSVHEDALFDALQDRYVMFGEWTYSKHTIFYDRLPHLLHEFDVYDRERSASLGRPFYLSTEARRALLAEIPVLPVPVLYDGEAPKRIEDVVSLVGKSAYRSDNWIESLIVQASVVQTGARAIPQDIAVETAGRLRDIRDRQGRRDPKAKEASLRSTMEDMLSPYLSEFDLGHVVRSILETDLSDLMEGLYIKVEEGDETVGRMKWVRPDFVQAIVDSGSHWRDRRTFPNLLDPAADMFSAKLKDIRI